MDHSTIPNAKAGQPSPYDDAFFAAITEPALRSARIIVPILIQFVQPQSVLDVGCGQGAWLKAFQENGIARLSGLDGDYVDRANFLIDARCFASVDLRRGTLVTETFDLAVCLEVGEHLPMPASPGLVDLLTNAAPLVLFSAAIPGQGGVDHINEQWPAFWRKLFAAHGYRRLDPIRRHIFQDQRIPGWYQQNIYLYASADAIARSLKLQAEEQRISHAEMELIHGHILARYQSLRGILGEVPRVLWQALRRRLSNRG